MLEFFGAVLRVAGAVDLSDLAFVFGPHLLEETDLRETALSVHFARVAGGREVRVHDRDGVLLRRRAFHGFGGIPPLLPPFAVMNGRYAVAQAAVLSKDGTVLALMGGIGSNRNEVALALSARGWSVVSGQYLVVDRHTGHTVPLQMPFDLRGTALDAARTTSLVGAHDTDCRPGTSALAGPSLLVRPERLAATVDPRDRLGAPHIVRICHSDGHESSLETAGFTLSVWPREAASALADAPRLRLAMPETGGAQEAADLIDERLAGHRTPTHPVTAHEMPADPAQGAAPCPGTPATPLERPAGSTTSASTRRAPRSSTALSSAGSSTVRTPAATT